jgi:hypothetical protein
VSRFGEAENLCDARYAGPRQNTGCQWSSSNAGSVVCHRPHGGRGCFCVSLAPRKKLRAGLEVRPSFSLSLNDRDLRLLEDLQAFFSCGWIRASKGDRTFKYEVRSIDDLARIILPHFERFPLRGCKARSCAGFAQVCQMIEQGDHLQRDGLRRIVDIAYRMNPGKRRHERAVLLKVLDEVKV